VNTVICCEIDSVVEDCINCCNLGLLMVEFDRIVPIEGFLDCVEDANAIPWLYDC
jgi:hypothetical protein